MPKIKLSSKKIMFYRKKTVRVFEDLKNLAFVLIIFFSYASSFFSKADDSKVAMILGITFDHFWKMRKLRH